MSVMRLTNTLVLLLLHHFELISTSLPLETIIRLIISQTYFIHLYDLLELNISTITNYITKFKTFNRKKYAAAYNY